MPSPSNTIPFAKMEGCGNDYIFIDTRQTPLASDFITTNSIKQLCKRYSGIGSDGLVFIESPINNSINEKTREEEAPSVVMRMWNADGSESAMCGNALRCITLWEYYQSKNSKNSQNEFVIQSGSGRHRAKVFEDKVMPPQSLYIEVEMPPPIFNPVAIPFHGEHKLLSSRLVSAKLDSSPICSQIYALSMGNPHCVLFVDSVAGAPVATLGVTLEQHPAFPQGTNVEFAKQRKDALELRTWERGSGETQACGSGACAAHVASVIVNKAPYCQKVLVQGGELEIEWRPTKNEQNFPVASPVLMRGPARLVYEGIFSIETFFCD